MSLVSISGILEADKLAHVLAKLTERACDKILGLILETRLWTSTKLV